MIYFTRSVHSKPIKMLSLYYHELMEKIEEHEAKKHLMADNFMLGQVLEKIKEIIGSENLMILRF